MDSGTHCAGMSKFQSTAWCWNTASTSPRMSALIKSRCSSVSGLRSGRAGNAVAAGAEGRAEADAALPARSCALSAVALTDASCVSAARTLVVCTCGAAVGCLLFAARGGSAPAREEEAAGSPAT